MRLLANIFRGPLATVLGLAPGAAVMLGGGLHWPTDTAGWIQLAIVILSAVVGALAGPTAR